MMSWKFCLFSLWIILISFAFGDDIVEVEVDSDGTVSDSKIVSPPFGKAFSEMYTLAVWADIARLKGDALAKYSPGFGKFGIAMSMIYGVRNARLAIQHYSKASTFTVDGKSANEIWHDMWKMEYQSFVAFNKWNSDNSQENWSRMVEYLQFIYFNKDALPQYREIFETDEFNDNISLRLKRDNGVGTKTFQPTFKHASILTGDYNGMSPMIELNNGYKIPLIGFGSWPMTGDFCKKTLLMAIKNGYRLIDTSQNYNNEEIIGQVIKESGLDRNELFIADKISHNQDYGKGKTKKAFMEQLKKLDIDYMDLYMTHGAISDKKRLKETWIEMEELYDEGLIKALGVSNYDVHDMKELLKYCKHCPTFIQNKYDVFTSGGQAPWVQPILKFAQEHNILVQGYCVTNPWPHQIPSYWDAHVKAVASNYVNKTSAQIGLRWALENGAAILVRSSNDDRQKENLNLFDFSLDLYDKQLLTALNTLLSPYDISWMHDIYEQLNRPQ
mmetsp:Transcript_8540/g.10609  ORF Transcript_8540/g.10609 Transcript_8540/m.10609 type:complete len:500 (+) Transcript_8540:15-1514(+)